MRNKNTVSRNARAALIRDFRKQGMKVFAITPFMRLGNLPMQSKYLCTNYQYFPLAK
jgi:hypothetical protein